MASHPQSTKSPLTIAGEMRSNLMALMFGTLVTRLPKMAKHICKFRGKFFVVLLDLGAYEKVVPGIEAKDPPLSIRHSLRVTKHAVRILLILRCRVLPLIRDVLLLCWGQIDHRHGIQVLQKR